MRFYEGDLVRVLSPDEIVARGLTIDPEGDILCGCYYYTVNMRSHAGQIFEIIRVHDDHYKLANPDTHQSVPYSWTDEMLELVAEEREEEDPISSEDSCPSCFHPKRKGGFVCTMALTRGATGCRSVPSTKWSSAPETSMFVPTGSAVTV